MVTRDVTPPSNSGRDVGTDRVITQVSGWKNGFLRIKRLFLCCIQMYIYLK